VTSTVVVESQAAAVSELVNSLGASTAVVANLAELQRLLQHDPDVVAVVVGASIDKDAVLAFAEVQRVERPALGVVLVRHRVETSLLREALRAGVREVVTDRQLSDVVEAVRHVRSVAAALHDRSDHRDEETGPAGGILVTVFAAKGGAGKTTIATNLAASLADGGHRNVCIVDLDLAFGDVAIALQLFPSHTIADAVPMGTALDDDAVLSLLTEHSPGLSALVAPIEPGVSDEITAATVASILEVLKRRFDFVIVDSPPAFTDQVLAAFDQSDVIALLTTLDIPALKNLKLSLEALDLLNYPRDRWRVVLNRADSKVGLVMNEVEKTLRIPISAEIPSSRAVPASINRGVPIVFDDPRHPVSLAIAKFAHEHVIPLSTGKVEGLPAAMRTDSRRLLRRKAKHA
jgi:pilus assembly protein CpaE